MNEIPWVQLPAKNGTVQVRILPARPFFLVGKGHAIAGQTYYCGREYPAITRQYELLADDFQQKIFIPICVEGCPACEEWRNCWKRKEAALGLGYDSFYALDVYMRSIKPFYRFYYQCIVRGQEDKGIQILSLGKQVHHNIITGLAAGYPFPLPKKTRWQAFKGWVRSWFGYVEPKPDLLDWKLGADFIIHRQNRRPDWSTSIPDYSGSAFAGQPTPAGDLFQIDEWKSKLMDLEVHVRKNEYEDIRIALEKVRPVV
jgi:hypothetical protein